MQDVLCQYFFNELVLNYSSRPHGVWVSSPFTLKPNGLYWLRANEGERNNNYYFKMVIWTLISNNRLYSSIWMEYTPLSSSKLKCMKVIQIHKNDELGSLCYINRTIISGEVKYWFMNIWIEIHKCVRF